MYDEREPSLTCRLNQQKHVFVVQSTCLSYNWVTGQIVRYDSALGDNNASITPCSISPWAILPAKLFLLQKIFIHNIALGVNNTQGFNNVLGIINAQGRIDAKKQYSPVQFIIHIKLTLIILMNSFSYLRYKDNSFSRDVQSFTCFLLVAKVKKCNPKGRK